MAVIKESTIQCRIPSRLKENVEIVFNDLGISTSEGIRLFLNQVVLTRSIPFEIKVHKNKETPRA